VAEQRVQWRALVLASFGPSDEFLVSGVVGIQGTGLEVRTTFETEDRFHNYWGSNTHTHTHRKVKLSPQQAVEVYRAVR
jgi:hypothetical protein